MVGENTSWERHGGGMRWLRKTAEVKVEKLSIEELMKDWQWGYDTGSHNCTLSAGQYALGCAISLPRERYIAFGLGYAVGEREHNSRP